ncbi:MAG TPA: transcriptional initiation protein Tat [Salinisphaeraceae bacterium]|nr:transcriptional initiation protein Tat [Salinisphaeraceae bacterium]
MKRKPQTVDESRRRLLGSAFGLGAVGVGAGAFGMKVMHDGDAADAATAESKTSTYRETEHIRRYYSTAW